MYWHDEAQRSSARIAAVLRDGALPLQLPLRARREIAGRDAEPPDRCARLQRPGSVGLPAPRGVYLQALLRPLPRVRAGPSAGGRLRADADADALLAPAFGVSGN